MDFTKMPTTAFKNIQINAGILVKTFTPATNTIGDILGATTGGISFSATPEFKDYGEDIDNCPKNMKELKKLDKWEAKLSGTFVTVTAELAKTLVGAGDIDSADTTKIVPRNQVLSGDFADLWWVGDYSDVNDTDGSTSAGFCAIHLINALSTTGFQIKSSDKGKGQLSFEFTAHYAMASQDTVPFEIYVKVGA